MDNQQALARLIAIEKQQAAQNEEIAALRNIIETSEPAAAPSLLNVAREGTRYWAIASRPYGSFNAVEYAIVLDANATYGGNHFTTQELAKAHAEAIDTMLLLRRQPGTVTTNGGDQFALTLSEDCVRVIISMWPPAVLKMRGISPSFSTRKHAQAAIDTLGEDRILRMFKTLHGIYD